MFPRSIRNIRGSCTSLLLSLWCRDSNRVALQWWNCLKRTIVMNGRQRSASSPSSGRPLLSMSRVLLRFGARFGHRNFASESRARWVRCYRSRVSLKVRKERGYRSTHNQPSLANGDAGRTSRFSSARRCSSPRSDHLSNSAMRVTVNTATKAKQ